MVRRASIADLPLLLKAQEESNFEMTAGTDLELASALSTGRMQSYILERDDRAAVVVSVVVEDEDALFCMFHRWGGCAGLLRDCIEILECIKVDLARMGVKRTALYLSKHNPKYYKLRRFYGHLGFEPDMTRMSGGV